MNGTKTAMATKLREARNLAGLSQSQAADLLSLQRPTISEIEAGKRKVSAEEIMQFAKVYKVDVNWLLGEQDNEEYDYKLQFAARELSKLNPDEIEKLLHIIKMFPK